MKPFTIALTVLFCSLVLLMSCSGGGGGTPGGGTNTAPVITSTIPSANATGVSVGSTISVVFNKDMSASTINTSTFYLRKTGLSTNVTGTVSYLAGSRTAIFAPVQTLSPGTTYTATVTTGVKESYGTAMASAHSWSFTTSAALTYTIGGIISNLNGTVVLQDNGGDNLSLARTAGVGNTFNGPFTFQNRVSDGGGYAVTVLTQPADAPQTCTVSNGTGTVNAANVTGIAINCVNTVGPLYSNGSHWNDYIRNDGSSRFNALNTACTGTETGGYSACIHGGETRFAEATGKTSCTGLTAQDTLGAFNWTCVQAVPYVKLVSTGLKEDKLLSGLIDFTTPAWKQNTLMISDVTGTILTTPSEKWWGNPVVFDNNGGALTTAGAIYLVTQQPADASAWYTVSADRVALLIQPGFLLHGTNGLSDVVTVLNSKFAWFEGELMGGTGGNSGLTFDGAKFSVVRKLGVRDADKGLKIGNYYAGNDNNMIMNVTASENSTGVYLSLGNHTTLANIVATNNNGDGISVFSGAAYDTMINVTSANNYGNGINLGYPDAHDIVMMNVTATNNGPGIYYSLSGNNNLLVNAGAINNYSDGIITNINIANNKFLNIASAHNGYPNLGGICQSYQISLAGAPNTFEGLVKIGTVPACSAQLCYSLSLTSGLTSTCASSGSSTASLVTGVTVTNIFTGKVSSDLTNTTDTAGTAAFDYYAIDWLHFDNSYRGWGLDGNAFPDTTNTGRCMSVSGLDTCRIWDWSMRATDTQLKGVLALPTGNDIAVHTWSAATPADCSAIAGAVWNSSTCTTTFLKNAVEILGDGIGNDNGLCESGENCLYTPNIGSYQGHGPLVSAGAFTNGTLTGITLLKRSTNGY